MKTRDQLRDLVGRTRDWLTGDDVSIRVLCVMLTSNFTVHKTPLPTTRPVCKAGTGVTVDVSSEERTSDLAGR